LRFVERLNRCGFGHWGAFVAEDDWEKLES
jgi:hypothetical protein